MLIKIRNTSTLLALCAMEGWRLFPPCSMAGMWNPAVLEMAWMWASGLKSASDLGIALNCPLLKSGTACGSLKFGSRSVLWVLLRYRVHQLVSTVSCMRLVSRFFVLLAPVA